MKNPDELTVALEAGAVTALAYPSDTPHAGASLILAHGAGAGQRSPFMVAFARAMATHGIDAVTFNFPYTEQGRKIPDRRPVLEACYLAVIDAVRRHLASARQRLFIGGKSMGGRMATHVAAANHDLNVAGLVLLGYPLHAPGRPDQTRDAHFVEIRRPMLIVQGSRDTFGTPAELQPALNRLSPRAVLQVVEGGDHSFKVSKGGAPAQQAAIENVYKTVAEWIGTTTGN